MNNKPELERLEFVPAERELVFRIREGIDRHVHHRNLADNRQRRHTDTGVDLAKDKKNERSAT